MATILEFRRPEAEDARKETQPSGALGEIVIFPGVRIERHEPAPSPVQPQARRRSPRARRKSRA